MAIFSSATQLYLAYGVAAIMAIGALVNLVGPAGIRDAYARWRYPANFRFVTAALEALSAVLVVIEATRAAGLLLTAAIMIAAVATLVRARELAHMAPGLIVLAAALLALA